MTPPLLNVTEQEVLSSSFTAAEAPLRDFEAQAIDGGYVLSGMGDSGMMAYIYDSSLSLKKEIAVNAKPQGQGHPFCRRRTTPG